MIMSMLLASNSLLLYVLWIALQFLVICLLTGRISVLGEDGLGICDFGRQNISSETPNEPDSNHTIYLLTLLPSPALPSSSEGNDSPQTVAASTEMGPALLPAAQLAVDHINQDPYTLPGFRVELINAESGCSMTTKALVSLIKHVVHSERNGRSITGIIGPSCSESAIVVSSVIARGGPLALPNVHITTSAELEDRETYPYTFGIIGSRSQIVDALVSLIGYNGWNKVAILYDESRASDALYANQRLREEVWDENFGKGDFSTIHTPVSNNFFPLETLIKSEVQIGIIMTTLILAQKLMCIAYHEGWTFPGYQWIIIEYSFNEFMEQNTTFYYEGRLYECFWGIVLDHVIFVHFRMSEVDATLQLVSGYTYTDITKQYEMKMDFYKYSNVCFFPAIPNFNHAATTYDAVWALVLAMNMSISEISDDSKINIQSLDKFPNVNFRGASGHITFDKSTGFIKRVVDIVQIENGIAISAGSVFEGNTSFNIDPRTKYITSSQQPRYATVNPILSAFFILAGVILLLSTAVVHVVTLLNRKHPSVKASSHGLNQFVFLACYIWGVVAIIYTLVKVLGLSDFVAIGNACNALLVWLIPIALTLSFGTLIAKTWRIYRIFIHFRHPGPLLTNKALTMMVLIQLGIDIVIATAWTIVSPIILIAVEEESYTNKNGENVIPRMCVYTNTAIWVTMTVGYKFLQLTALFILCIMTRAIKNRKFSTTSLKVASYLCLLTIAITGPIYAILWYTNAEIHADFVVFCVFFGAIGFTLLILVILPPILPMLMGYLCHQHRRK